MVPAVEVNVAATEVTMMDMTTDVDWDSVHALFRARVGEETYRSGFHTMEFALRKETVAEVSVPHGHLAHRLKALYLDDLEECIFSVKTEVETVTIRVREARPHRTTPPGRRVQVPILPETARPERLKPSRQLIRDVEMTTFSTFDWYAWLESIGVVISRKISISQIIRVTCEHQNQFISNVCSSSRFKEAVFARQVVMYLARQHTTLSLPMIGRALGLRDHATVLHGTNRIRERRKTDEFVRNVVDDIEGRLGVR